MIFLIVGIFFTWTAYRKAKQKGRSPIRWAGIAAIVFIGTQFFFLTGLGSFYWIGEGWWGWSEYWIKTREIPITVLSLVISVFTNWLALRPLNKTQEEFSAAPPSPPTFEQKDLQ